MVTEVGPVKDIVSTSRSGVCHAAKLESAEDVDKYVADVKAKLLQMLNGHDALHNFRLYLIANGGTQYEFRIYDGAW